MSATICRHVKINGARCGSPALGGRTLCYHHMRVADHHRSINPPNDGIPTIIHPIDVQEHMQRNPLVAQYYNPKPGPLLLDLPPLEDRESIQIALSMLITAMAQNRIDSKRASGMIYALQVASNNAQSLNNTPSRSLIVRETVLDEHGNQIAPDEDPESEVELQQFLNSIENEEDKDEDEDDFDDEDEPSLSDI